MYYSKATPCFTNNRLDKTENMAKYAKQMVPTINDG